MKRSTMVTLVVLVVVVVIAAYFVSNLWMGRAPTTTCPANGSSCGDIFYPGNGIVVALMGALHA